MKCPKCEEGNIIKVIFKNSGDCGVICDRCEALWFANEAIDAGDAHKFRSFSQGLEREQALEAFDEEDQDHSPINYTSYK
jgi:hypothetical protein